MQVLRECIRDVVYAWIRDDAPLTIKMRIDRESSDALIDRLTTAMQKRPEKD